jgi:hypothetical protein
MNLEDIKKRVADLRQAWEDKGFSLEEEFAIIDGLIAEVERLEKEAENALKIAEDNVAMEIAAAGSSCHWCMGKTRKDTEQQTARECAEIAVVRTFGEDAANEIRQRFGVE